jgi:hypothetical protein
MSQLFPDAISAGCQKAADADDSSLVDVDDAFAILRWNLAGGPPLAQPFPAPGPDPNPDALPCAPLKPGSRERDPAYGITWRYPETVQADQIVNVFLEARTPGRIEGFSISYWYNSMVADVLDVGFEGTVLSSADELALEESEFFQWGTAPSLLPESSMFTAGAVFVRDSPLEWMSFDTTSDALDGDSLLRVTLHIHPDAPLVFGTTRLLWPADEPPPESEQPGANEYSASGVAHLAAEVGEVEPNIIDAGEFIRGDANQSLSMDMSDSIYILTYLFLGTRAPDCEKAADVNDDGKVDMSDGIYGLNFLFLGGSPPPEPKSCAEDSSPDELPCLESACPPH